MCYGVTLIIFISLLAGVFYINISMVIYLLYSYKLFWSIFSIIFLIKTLLVVIYTISTQISSRVLKINIWTPNYNRLFYRVKKVAVINGLVLHLLLLWYYLFYELY